MTIDVNSDCAVGYLLSMAQQTSPDTQPVVEPQNTPDAPGTTFYFSRPADEKTLCDSKSQINEYKKPMPG